MTPKARKDHPINGAIVVKYAEIRSRSRTKALFWRLCPNLSKGTFVTFEVPDLRVGRLTGQIPLNVTKKEDKESGREGGEESNSNGRMAPGGMNGRTGEGIQRMAAEGGAVGPQQQQDESGKVQQKRLHRITVGAKAVRGTRIWDEAKSDVGSR